MFVAAGGGIQPGTLNRTVSTLDFAPTFAALTGASLGTHDGKVIPEILGSG